MGGRPYIIMSLTVRESARATGTVCCVKRRTHSPHVLPRANAASRFSRSATRAYVRVVIFNTAHMPRDGTSSKPTQDAKPKK